MVGVQYMLCYQATNRTDPQNLLSTTLDVPLQFPSSIMWHNYMLTKCQLDNQ